MTNIEQTKANIERIEKHAGWVYVYRFNAAEGETFLGKLVQVDDLQSLAADHTALQQRAERMEKALRHYADKERWYCESPYHREWEHENGCFDSYNYERGGKYVNGYDIAREALGEDA